MSKAQSANPFDQSILNACEGEDQKNLIREAFDNVVRGPESGLLDGQVARSAVALGDEISDEYRQILTSIFDKNINGREDEKSERLASFYLADSREILSVMDSQRKNAAAPLPMDKVVEGILSDSSLSEAQKLDKARSEGIRETYHAIEQNLESKDEAELATLRAFKDLYIRERDGEGVTLDFQGKSAADIIAAVKEKVNITDNSKDTEIGQLAKLVIAGQTLGVQMYKSKALAIKLSSPNTTAGLGDSFIPPPTSQGQEPVNISGLPGSSGGGIFNQSESALIGEFDDFITNGDHGLLNKRLLNRLYTSIQYAGDSCSMGGDALRIQM